MLLAGYSQSQIVTIWEEEIFRLTNIERANHGVSPLTFHAAMSTAARGHSNDMLVNNMRGHIGSDGSRVGDRLTRAGVNNFSGWSENVSYRTSTPHAVVQGWMNSPDHRRNILNSNRTHIGVGVAFSFDGLNVTRAVHTQKFTIFR
ncbi:MAG: CAP domain-containing protein, partial [Clostridiales bacterium]|jgi:uncharacterized protein YkwD|nr:CAP domain-containing protein [Clostridiales bacterium]